jgi:pyruvate dehydrogenase E1 component beta subunit
MFTSAIHEFAKRKAAQDSRQMMHTREITYREAINEALRQEMRCNPDVVVVGEDVAGGAGLPPQMQDAFGGVFGVTKGLIGEFGPTRVWDTPISETGYVGAAVGAAATGLRPVAELMFVSFMGVCMDQLMNQGAKLRYMFGGKPRVPLTVRTVIGGGVRAGGQHSTTDYSIFAHIPGLKCVAPSTPYDAKGLLIAAIRDDDPVIFCEHIQLYNMRGPVPEESYSIDLGKANVMRKGTDITVVAFSRLVHIALKAAEHVAKDGISVEVIDPRSLSPLDELAILKSIGKTHHLVVVDEDTPRCSIATDVVAMVSCKAFDLLAAPPQMVTPPHTPAPYSPSMEDFYIPTMQKVAEAFRLSLETVSSPKPL